MTLIVNGVDLTWFLLILLLSPLLAELFIWAADGLMALPGKSAEQIVKGINHASKYNMRGAAFLIGFVASALLGMGYWLAYLLIAGVVIAMSKSK